MTSRLLSEYRAALSAVGPAVGALVVFAFSLIVARAALPVDIKNILAWGTGLNPAVNYACTGRFAEIDEISPQLAAFLDRRQDKFGQDRFDCADIALATGQKGLHPFAEFWPVGKPGTLNPYAGGIPYYLRGLGLYWSLTGISWSALTPLAAAFFVATGLLTYLLFREFTGSLIACAGACLFLAAPSNFYLIRWYEHYTQVPLALSILLIITLLVRRIVSWRVFLGSALMGGAILGIGFGIRADLWLLNVPFLAVLLVFARAKFSWMRRIAASFAFIVVTAALALPAMRVEAASFFWLQLVQGLATPFGEAMDLQRPVYEWVPAYNDVLGMDWLRSHLFYTVDHGGPADIDRIAATPDGRMPEPPRWQELEAAGSVAYLRLMRYFPADFMVRPLAATFKVITQSFTAQPLYVATGTAETKAFLEPMRPVWASLARFGPALPLLLAVELLALAFVRRREALFFTLLILFVGGTQAIVFIDRHSAHLYFIGFLAAGIAVRAILATVWRLASPQRGPAFAPDRLRPTLAAASKTFSLCVCWVGGAAGLLLLANQIQRHIVGNLIATVLAAEGERLSLTQQPTPTAGTIAVSRPLIEQFDRFGSRSTNFEYSYYMRAKFAREQCAGITRARLAYEASGAFYDASQQVDLAFDRDSNFFYLIFPAYYLKTPGNFSFFKGIEVPSSNSGCVAELDRVRAPQDLPFLITWHIPENWSGGLLYERPVSGP